ncbi:MAG: ankyrin repeat domain-containing protein [Spirochaetia bacterium]
MDKNDLKINLGTCQRSTKFICIFFVFLLCSGIVYALSPADNLNSLIGAAPIDERGLEYEAIVEPEPEPRPPQPSPSTNQNAGSRVVINNNRPVEEGFSRSDSNNNNNVIVIDKPPVVVEKIIEKEIIKEVPAPPPPEPKPEPEPEPKPEPVYPPAPTIIQVLPALPPPPLPPVEVVPKKPKKEVVIIPIIEEEEEEESNQPVQKPQTKPENNKDEVTQVEDPLADFFRAVSEDNDILVREFLDEDELWLRRTNDLGQYALHVAAERAALRVLPVLIGYGSKVAQKDRLDNTALDIALMHDDSYDHARIAEALIRAGSRPPKDDRFTYLMSVLRSNGDLFQQFDLSGQTALHLAAEKDHTGFVVLFLKKGISIRTLDGNGFTPLHSAVKGRGLQAIRVLLESGADVNVPDFAQSTPLHLAFSVENPYQVITLLLSYGADANAPNIYGNTPLILVAIWNLDSRVAVELMSYRARINTRNNYGDYALLQAVKRGNIELSYFFLNNGADPYVRNNQGESAASVAAVMGGDLMTAFNAYANRW